jgi:DNA-binding transcriptional regulator YdaS (Cro superfamily)
MPAMDAKQFLLEFRNEVPTVCQIVGTSPAYFNQIAYGHRRPSVDMAVKLATASGGRMSVTALLGIDAGARRNAA